MPGRIYAIGDIHGQVTMLRTMLAGLPLRDEDTLICLGDYVDRGEDSRAVIETLLDLKRRHEDVVFLRGNHEQLMLDARADRPPEPSPVPGLILYSELMLNWLQNGGVETLLSYKVTDFLRWPESIPDAHWTFLENTVAEKVSDRYHFVHAGLLPAGRTWEGGPWGIDPRLWIREPFLSSLDDFDGRIVVFGHTPQETGMPLIQANKIGLDTAAVMGGPLTAVELDPTGSAEPHFYQVAYTVADT